ncbi:MAG: hypothetical protein ILP13_01955, partial [Lachnospiraceae bacterium]|nr:hypothetical protein [Lachnospiraceae bacterium]
SGTSGGDDYEVCIRQAKSMGVDVVLEGTIPRDKQLRSVIDTAITVHITNILRHTDGRKAYVLVEYEEESCIIVLTGDEADGSERVSNSTVTNVVNETGGLKNLRYRVESSGGTMVVSSIPKFTIKIVLPFRNAER